MTTPPPEPKPKPDEGPVSPAELAWLRAAFAESPVERATPVDPEQLWAAARGELDPDQTAAIVDQLHRDPALAEDWRLAVELGRSSAAATVNAAPEVAAPAANDRRYWVAGLLAAAAAAAIAIWVVDGKDPAGIDPVDGPPVLRANGNEAQLTTELADGVTLPRAALDLRWSPIPDAARYELRVTTEALDPVYQALDLAQPELRIPSEALATLPEGTVLLWSVIAVMPDGRQHSSAAWRIVVD